MKQDESLRKAKHNYSNNVAVIAVELQDLRSIYKENFEALSHTVYCCIEKDFLGAFLSIHARVC